MSLFTDSNPTSLTSMPVERTGRFVLHRAGIRNVWQYDDLELAFSGGRLLLRGKNGAGKSKAMEMLLPFLLDGDTRNIDCVSRDRTTLGWLMTDGRDGGNQIGYMWIELRAVDAEGNEEFRSLGCGVKAAPSTRRPASWFFFTDKRVGDTLEVADATGMVSQEAFREQLDADEYFTSAAPYARRVAKDLFGIDDDVRYRNLCHLLYELRRPSVGESIEAGQHTKVLTEALPPLDDDLLADVARNFDDLKKIREDLARAEQTSRALNEFLSSYRGYTRTIVRTHAQRVVETADAAVGTRRQLARAEEREEAARGAADDATGAVDDLEAQHRNAQTDLQVLMASPAYQSLQSINDRRERVESSKRAADSAASAAEVAVDAEEGAAGRVTASASEVDGEVLATSASRRELEPLVVAAGFDGAVLPSPIAITEVKGTASSGAPRRIDVDTTTAEVDRYTETLDALGRSVTGQRTNVRTLVEAGAKVTTADDGASRAAEHAADAEAAFEAAQADEAVAAATAQAADRTWRRALNAWIEAATSATPGVDWSAIDDFAAFDEDTATLSEADVAEVASTIDTLLVDPTSVAADAVASARVELRSAEEELVSRRRRRQGVEGQPERIPTRSRFTTADRDSTAGVPFYALVEVRAGVDDTIAAGVEAALEASGLLDGWVTPTGTVVAPDTCDLVITAAPLAGRRTLADILEPALPPSSPVDVGTVDAILASIAIDEDGASSMIGADGSWRLGVARGAWAKGRVEFLGVGARRAARERELADIDRLIADAAKAVEDATEALTTAQARHTQLTELTKSLPGTRDLLAALARGEAQANVTQRARTASQKRRELADEARQEAINLRREFAERAQRANLPADVPALQALNQVLDRLDNQLRHAQGQPKRIDTALCKHTADIAAWGRAADTRARLEGVAAYENRKYNDEFSQLNALEDVYGEDARTVQANINDAEASRDEAEKGLPAARDARDAAKKEHTLAEDAVQRLVGEVVDADRTVEAAAATLGRVLAGPGVGQAAFGATGPIFSLPEPAVGADDQARVRQLRSFTGKVLDAAAGGQPVTDSTILRRYEALTSDGGLAAGYEAAQDETADHVKVFEIHDDTGRHPIAVVAERLAREVNDAQGRLTARQEEVFERFLLGELGDHLRRQLLDADTLCAAMNKSLVGVRTSHGLGVKLDWHLKDDVAPEREEAIPLLRESAGIRGADKNRRLGELLGALIESERLKDPTAPYDAHLRAALDYRSWHTFTIKVVDDSNPGRERKLSNKLAVSQGEQRVLAYLALFSGAAAYFDSLRRKAPHAPRVILLDDAFAKVDEPTHGRLLNLLVELDLDFIITSERVTGCVPGISLEVYECLRDPRMRGVAIVHTHWDGQRAQLQAV